MKIRHSFLLGVAAIVGAGISASATTVVPPTFEQLVDQAQVIFQGTVSKVNSQWIGEGADRHIVTYVTFDVKESLKGKAGKSYTISTFGGTVDGESMMIGDAPTFEVGDDQILFVENNGSQVIPLVGLMHGQFRVRKDDAGREMVTTNTNAPVRDVERLGREKATAESASAMTPAAFKAAISARLTAAPIHQLP